jgi:uncharacterized protein YxeA
MKKIMIAALGLSMLSGTVVFAQNTSSSGTDTNTMKSTKKSRKNRKSKSSTNTSSTSSGTMN